MLSRISWREYFETLLVLAVIYYSIVLLLYYRSDLLRLAKEGFRKPTRKKSTPVKQDQLSSAHEKSSATNDNSPALFSSVHDLMEDLKSLFAAASQKPFQKQELLLSLQLKLGEYAQLQGTAFQVAVNNHIVQQSQVQCDISINDAEIKQLW